MGQAKMEKTKFVGVFYLESGERRFQGKPDRSFYITYPDQAGKKVREKVGWASEGYTAQLAQQVRSERVRAIRHGKELPQKKQGVTFAEAWEKYYEWASVNKKSCNSDISRYRHFLKDSIGKKRLSEITPLDLERIKKKMNDQGLAPQTITHALVVVGRIYNLCRKWGIYVGSNPCENVRKPSTDLCKRLRFLTHEEAGQLLEELEKQNRQCYEIAILSLHIGMRAGEILGLLWGDIDLDHDSIHIKGKMGIPRDGFITSAVKSVLSEKKTEEVKASDLVFPNRHGRKRREVPEAFGRAVDSVGLNDGVKDRVHKVVFHTLRHTFASWLAIQGTPILTIKELMGHKDIKMTLRYAHLMPDQKKEAVRALEKAFEEKRGKVVRMEVKDRRE